MLRKCRIILMLLPVYIFLYAGLAAASAKIKIPFDSWNFGDVPMGETLSHDFEIYNAGKSLLAIADIHAPCGCTAVVLFSDSVPSGKMGTIHVKLDSSLMKLGKFKKHITIYSNAVRNPRMRLALSGVVVGLPEPRIKIHDQLVDLGVFFPKQSKNFNVTFANDGDATLRLKKLASVKYLSTSVKLAKIVLKPGEKKQVLFTLVPPVKYGAFSMLFGILSNDPARPEEYLRLKGYVTDQKAVIIYKSNGGMLLVNGLGEDVSVREGGEKEKLLKNAGSLRVAGKSANITLAK